jgi:hypothetical protein
MQLSSVTSERTVPEADTTMNTSTSVSILDPARQALARFMAVEGAEWDVVRSSPYLRTEIVYHAIAVLYCSAFFAWSTFNIALGLLRYPFVGAMLVGAGAAFGLGSIDRQLRIQTRGVPDASRWTIRKVRVGSFTIVGLSGLLMATHSFRDDIDAYLFQVGQAERAALERSSEYAVVIESARDEVAKAARAQERADELKREISRIRTEEARAWENYKNECEGNTTDNQTRSQGCGPRARGYEAAAIRLGQERQSVEAELGELAGAEERVVQARAVLAQVDAQIDADVGRSIQGASQRIDALFVLMRDNWAARFTIAFWVLLGMLPDIMMWIALGRSVNDPAYAGLRDLQMVVLQARLAEMRSRLRSQGTERLAPLEVQVTAVAGPAPKSTTAAPARPAQVVQAQERAA